MKSLEKGWRYLLVEPFIWIAYCFFQPARFQRDIEIPGYFKLRRIAPLLRVSIPLFLCSFLFFCCALYIDIIFHSFVINTPKFLSITAWLLLGLIILTLPGGFILSLARGIVLASTWSVTYTIISLFFIYNPNNGDTPSAILLGFGLSGGILFSTVFGNSSDLSGDLTGSVVWAAGVFSIKMMTVHSWVTVDLLFVAAPVGSITGGLVVWLMTRNTKTSKGEILLKKSLLWGNIWGISFAILIGITASESSDATYHILLFSVICYAIFCFAGSIIYISGYYRLLLYPFSCFSILNTYFLSKLHPPLFSLLG